MRWSAILEVSDRLRNRNLPRRYLNVSNLYPKPQAPYQMFHSAENSEMALLRVRNDILKALDNKKEVILAGM